ncbi:MAG: nitroreductase [Cyclobacteriaceae bacterium]
MSFNTEETDALIETRRSTFPKDYTGEKVPDHIVKRMIENATWAPTHKLTEPWRFMVFTGEGLQKLAKFQSELYKKITTQDGTFREERYENLRTKPMQSSHIIAVGMQRDKDKRVPEVEELGAVFCAIQNMYLTAHAYGVGCYLSTGGVTYFPEAKSFFRLGEEDTLLGFMHVGMPKTKPGKTRRKPIDHIMKWVNS